MVFGTMNKKNEEETFKVKNPFAVFCQAIEI